MSSNTPQGHDAVGPPILDIPLEHETWASFRERLEVLLPDPNTHTYIDTSFLMWLTKIGATSRSELLAWFQSKVADRVHVPVWAAHEYIKHHVNQTIVDDFNRKHRALRTFATRTYADLRPFIDEHPSGPANQAATLRLSIRETLNRLNELIDEANKWPQNYGRHSADVFKFVNETAPTDTSVFSDLTAVATHGEIRLTSAIPPGFNDLYKQQRTSSDQDLQSHGRHTNEYGDLMFWREVLAHARRVAAHNILVISNDAKNDWRFGGPGNTASTDPHLRKIRSSWKPVPRPHPILIVEARLKASVTRLELLDSIYLGLYLKDTAAPDVANFIDVALIPERYDDDYKPSDQPPPSDQAPPETQSPSTSPPPSTLFADPDHVSATPPKLARALYLSRRDVDDDIEKLVSDWAEQAPTRTDPEQLIHPTNTFSSLGHHALTALARILHDRARAHEPGYPDTLADALSILPRMPDSTAASFYLGFLASMYLDHDSNQSLIPPASPVAQRLLEFQAQAFATVPIAVLSQRLLDNESQPIYIPVFDPAQVRITLHSDPTGPVPKRIGGIYVHHNYPPNLIVNLLTPAQTTESLRLASLFGSDQPVPGSALVDTACELFALPKAQIAPDASINRAHLITETAGFKIPTSVRIVKDS